MSRAMEATKAPQYFRSHPWTGNGVAQLAAGPSSRLLSWQLVTSIGVFLVTLGFVQHVWWPVVKEAAGNLPKNISLIRGVLSCDENQPKRLGENRFLAIHWEPGEKLVLGQTSDVQWVLRPDEVRISGIFGHVALDWPNRESWSTTGTELSAWWGATDWVWSIALGLLVSGCVWISWWCLGILYLPLAWLGAGLLGKWPGIFGGIRLSSAALLVGAWWILAGVVAYGMGLIRLPSFLVWYGTHLALGWIWLFWATWHWPRRLKTNFRKNPFD